MTISRLLLGAVSLALFVAPAFAEDQPSDLKTMTIGGKTVITDAKGMTLYTYDKDGKGATTSTCADKCAAAWPPAFVAAGAKPVGEYTIVKSADGKDLKAGRPSVFYTLIFPEKRMVGIAGEMALIRAISSVPSMPGMRTSLRTRSIFPFWKTVSASSAVVQQITR